MTATALRWMGLAMALTCDGSGSARTGSATATPPPVVALGEREMEIYATGTRAEIDLVRAALRSGAPVDSSRVEASGARAAGVPVEDFVAIRSTVEAALKSQSAIAGQVARLDSLRIELLVLRVRAEALQAANQFNGRGAP